MNRKKRKGKKQKFDRDKRNQEAQLLGTALHITCGRTAN